MGSSKIRWCRNPDAVTFPTAGGMGIIGDLVGLWLYKVWIFKSRHIRKLVEEIKFEQDKKMGGFSNEITVTI